MPELRQNIVTGEWVVIAPERAKRPQDFITATSPRRQTEAECLFCRGREAYQARLKTKGTETDLIYTVANKFPAYTLDHRAGARRYFPEGGFYGAKPALGGHEVIVVKDHHLDLPRFPQPVMEEMLFVIHNRYLFYGRQRSVQYIMGIYNHGAQAGMSIEHPHAQLFASSIVPNLVLREKHGAERYYENTGSCVFCDLLVHEKKAGLRFLDENKDFLAFTFFAARFPFEVWLLPKAHESRFEASTKSQLRALASILRAVLARLNHTLNDPPLNFFIHSLPPTSLKADYYHWHLEVAPRVATYGGYELGSGVVIDVVNPELAARYLLGKRR